MSLGKPDKVIHTVVFPTIVYQMWKIDNEGNCCWKRAQWILQIFRKTKWVLDESNLELSIKAKKSALSVTGSTLPCWTSETYAYRCWFNWVILVATYYWVSANDNSKNCLFVLKIVSKPLQFDWQIEVVKAVHFLFWSFQPEELQHTPQFRWSLHQTRN